MRKSQEVLRGNYEMEKHLKDQVLKEKMMVEQKLSESQTKFKQSTEEKEKLEKDVQDLENQVQCLISKLSSLGQKNQQMERECFDSKRKMRILENIINIEKTK